MKIGKLMFLQTLDLQGLLELKEIPVSIVQLRNLMFLYIEFECPAYIPVGYKNLTSLEELVVPFSEDTNPEELGYLTELRVLNIFLPSSYPPRKLLILMESLGKLRKLQRIYIGIPSDKKIDNLGDWVPSLPQLLVLALEWWYEKMPTWIRGLFGLYPMVTIPNNRLAQEIWWSFGLVPKYWLALDARATPV
jgi:hypothetical protein